MDDSLINYAGGQPSQLMLLLSWYGEHWILGTLLLLTISWMWAVPFHMIISLYKAKKEAEVTRSIALRQLGLERDNGKV